MKRFTLSLILITILATCCTNRRSQYGALLAEIDSLTEVNADSARLRLADLRKEMEFANAGTKAYYDLLSVKADDKAWVKHTSDSLICAVARYYEKNDTQSGHLPEAYYYVGRVNSDIQNGEKALIYFQKALLEDSIHVTPRLKSRIFAQMGYIYLRNGLFDDAISMQQLAHFYCEQIGDTLGMRYSQEDIQTIAAMFQNIVVDSIPQKGMMTKVQKLQEQVKNHMLHQQNQQLQTETERRGRAVWGVTIVAILAIATAAWIAFRLHRQTKSRKQETPTVPPSPPTKRQFYDHEISQLIAAHITNNKVLKAADWQLIEERLLKTLPAFRDRLYSLYNLSETEYHICMLIKLEVSPTNMAKLMATGNSTISQSRLRMQQKVFGGEGTAKDWDKFVLSL